VWQRGLGRTNRLLWERAYPLFGCEVAVAPVWGRRRMDAIIVSRVGDFDLGLAAPRRALELGPYIPYCADYAARRLHLTRLAPGYAGKAPFLYMAQRRFADELATVSFDRLAELMAPEPVGQQPLLIFSIGRCGSTLVTQMLDAAGLRAFSEPQTVGWFGPGHPGDRRLVVRATLAALQWRAGDRAVAVKTRSEASSHFDEITGALPGADCVFMFRAIEGWARSWISAFRGDFDKMSQVLCANIDALERSSACGAAHRIVWYEDVLGDPEAACRTILGPGRRVDAAADFSPVLARDSQQGTALSRERLDARRRDGAAEIAARTAAFLRHWRAVQPRARIEALGLDPLVA
jgi:hypothetical protein